MAEKAPAYVLHVARFEKLMYEHGFASKSEFARKTGMPLRTLNNACSGTVDLSGRTIHAFLTAFPEATFEYLFVEPQRRRKIAA